MTNRRDVLRQGLSMAGGGLFGSALTAAKTHGAAPMDAGGIFDVTSFGATGRRADNATQAFRDAIAACVARGGGTVNVPPGAYTVGTVQLKDNVTLNVEAGATLFLSQSEEDFERGARAMIFAENAKNIGVTGGGTLNGLARYVYTEMRGVDPYIEEAIEIARAAGVDMRRYYRDREAMNTFMFVLNDCTDVTLRGVSIINSPLWNVRLNDCDRVHVDGVYIYSDLEKGVNADGIDICSSTNVMISDSVIVTGDDSIVVKTIARDGREARASENVTVTNCILSSSSCALKVGTETEADIRHLLFTNCTIRNTNKAIGIDVLDGARVSNVIFSNLTIETNRRHWNWWGDADLCKFLLMKRHPDSKLGEIRDVIISNVISHSRGTSEIIGHPEQPIENLTIQNVQQFMDIEDYTDKRATHSMMLEHVRGLRIRDFSVAWREDATGPKWQSALVLKNVTDFVVDSFYGRQGLRGGDAAAIVLDDAADGLIRESQATEGTATFIHVRGRATQDITLRNNDTRKATEEVTFEDDALREQVTRTGA